MSAPADWVVMLRHGHSEWNLSDRFTGWTDIPLTEVGLAEAAAAGRRLAAAGFAFDEVHGSVLLRTRQTADALLAAMGTPEVPLYTTWRLNERHYGALQGLNKREIFSTWGEEASRRWWRGYYEPPPPLQPDDPRHPRFDPLYAALPPEDLPASESLRDCQRRTLPYWRAVLVPRLRAGRRLLVVSHGNTLRGLVMHLDGLSAGAMEKVEIPCGVPLVYRFAADLSVTGHEWLDVPGAARGIY
jgi:2,3-bisphosphoglycerate-dependent phosphoglycerate mutase